MVPGEVIRGGISEEGRGSGRSPEVFKAPSIPHAFAARSGRCRPEVASRPRPGGAARLRAALKREPTTIPAARSRR